MPLQLPDRFEERLVLGRDLYVLEKNEQAHQLNDESLTDTSHLGQRQNKEAIPPVALKLVEV